MTNLDPSGVELSFNRVPVGQLSGVSGKSSPLWPTHPGLVEFDQSSTAWISLSKQLFSFHVMPRYSILRIYITTLLSR